MAQNDLLKRYIDAGIAFTELTQARAEAIVKDLVKAGEVQADQAREAVADLLDRSRKNTEQLLETVRREVKEQITNLGLVSKADLDKAEERLARLVGTATAPVRKAAAQEGRRPRRRAKKAAGQEGPGQEGRGQEGGGQEGRRQEAGLSPWPGAASTPSWCAGAWPPAASRPRRTSPPAG